MATMQEYLEEMAKRQAAGWTPGVPNRYLGALPTSYAPFSNLGALWAGSQPRVNLSDIAAASNPQSTARRRGRPRTSPEKLQSISDRQGTGTLGKTVKSIAPMLSAVSKVAGPAAIAYDALRSDPAVASTEVPPGGYFYESQAYPSMAVEEGYPNVSTLPSFDITPDAGGAVGGPPGGADKYGPSGYEGERIPPEGFRQIAPDTVIAASDFEVGPTSMAQVVSPVTDQDYIDEGTIPPGDDLDYTRFLDKQYGGPDLSTAVQTQVDDFSDMPSWDTSAVSIPGLGHTGGKTTAPIGTDFLSGTVFPALTGEPFGPYDDAQKTIEDWKGLGLIDDWDAGVMKGHQLSTVGAVPGSYTNTLGGGLANTVFSALQPLDQIVDEWGTANPLASAWRGALGGTANLVGQMTGPPDTPVTAAYELMNQGVRPASHFAIDEQGAMSPALREMVTQVDEFAPTVTTPAVTTPTGPTKAELKAAAAAQRKADLAEQKAAARRTRLARQALKDSQAAAAKAQAASAAQAKVAQAKAKAVLARMNNDRNAPSQREINAAIEVMSQVDTFGSGGMDGGGFDPQGGTTGSSGMGDWT